MISAAVDWGSSWFRAYRFDSSGNHIDSISAECGIKFVEDKGFESTLRAQIGHWISPGDAVVLSGMITSRNGWVESNYIKCPANLNDIVKCCSRATSTDTEFLFLPGISQSVPVDVMRGEELQLLGATQQSKSNIFVIPGTHSKWAVVEDMIVKEFRTIPTGELFDLLIRHSLIGALAEESNHNETAFNQGVETGFETSHIVSDLFTTRSSILLKQKTGCDACSWLSGLLIGNEIREGQTLTSLDHAPLEVIGSSALCEKYCVAFEHLGIQTTTAGPDVTINGYRHIIQMTQN